MLAKILCLFGVVSPDLLICHPPVGWLVDAFLQAGFPKRRREERSESMTISQRFNEEEKKKGFFIRNWG